MDRTVVMGVPHSGSMQYLWNFLEYAPRSRREPSHRYRLRRRCSEYLKASVYCSYRGDHSLLKARPEQIDEPHKDMQHPRCGLGQLLLCNRRNEGGNMQTVYHSIALFL